MAASDTGRERSAAQRPESAQEPRLLALETSSPEGSVALACAGAIAERTVPTPREQTERLLPLVDELMSEAGLRLTDLDAIVFGRGPGSFTGLRIAAALAQGLALAAKRPVIAVSSLAALAERARREHGAQRVLTCVDARMGEVYWATYALPASAVAAGAAAAAAAAVAAGGAPAPFRLEGEERLGAPETVTAPAPARRPWFAAGSGWARYAETLAPLLAEARGADPGLNPRARDLLPRAAADCAAGRLLSPAQALPVYLRSESAWRRQPP